MKSQDREVQLTPGEALNALNELRSNVVATQSAGWSNLAYPLVAILNAAGLEQFESSDEQQAEHLACYCGAGGFPGHLREPVGQQLINARLALGQSRGKEEVTMTDQQRDALRSVADCGMCGICQEIARAALTVREPLRPDWDKRAVAAFQLATGFGIDAPETSKFRKEFAAREDTEQAEIGP